jgi:hypothetical protein
MREKTVEYSRETFLKLLKESFGTYDINNGILIFRSTSNKEIADALGMGEAQFSKVIRKLPETEHEYRRIIDRILLYRDATQYRSYRRYMPILAATLIISLIASLVININQSKQLQKIPQLFVKTTSGIHTSSSPTLSDILTHSGSSNIHQLKWEAVRLNQKIKVRSTPLTYQDSIKEIRSLMSSVAKIIRDERKAFQRLNLVFPSGKSLADLLEENVPIEDGKMYNYTAEEIISISDTQKFKENATFFDLGIQIMYPTVLNKEIEYHQIVAETIAQVSVIQKGILDTLKKAAKAEYN